MSMKNDFSFTSHDRIVKAYQVKLPRIMKKKTASQKRIRKDRK